MEQLQLWVTLVGVAAPLITLAASAVAYVVKFYEEANLRRHNQFFELMQFIDSEKPLATKMAAVYELRRFPKDRDFLIRFCESIKGNVRGETSTVLVGEIERTLEFLRAGANEHG